MYVYPFNSAAAVNLYHYCLLCSREERKTRRVHVYIWAKSSHYSRRAAHHSHPSSLKQLSFSSLGSVCIFANDDLLFALSAAEAFSLRCKSWKHFKPWLQRTVASAFLVWNLGKFMIDVTRGGEFNSPPGTTSSLKHTSCHGDDPPPPQKTRRSFGSCSNTQTWITIDLFVILLMCFLRLVSPGRLCPQ